MLRAALRIHSVEVRHAAYIGEIRSRKPGTLSESLDLCDYRFLLAGVIMPALFHFFAIGNALLYSNYDTVSKVA